MNRQEKKCVLYPRVSTEMQVDGYSLEGRKNSLRRFADREEMEIVGIYEDAGKSGKSIEGRPAFKKMLSDIKNGLEIYRWRLIIATCAEHSRLRQLHLCASAYPPEGLYIWQLFNARYIDTIFTMGRSSIYFLCSVRQ